MQRHYFANKGLSSQGYGFPVVMYGCESWTVKKAECRRIDAFELWGWRRLESPLNYKEIQPVHPKGDQSWVFTGRTDVEAETPILWPLMWRADSLEKILMLGKIEGRIRRGQQRMRCLDGITDYNGHGFGWTLGVGDGQGGLACCGSWGPKESDLTEPLNWTMQLASVGFGANTTESWKAYDIIYSNRKEGDHPGRVISIS